MTLDSEKYDLPIDELQTFMLGYLTAAHIDSATAVKYLTDTFDGYPDIPDADLPSFLRLSWEMTGRLTQIINFLRDEPTTKPYIERILDKLRTRDLFS